MKIEVSSAKVSLLDSLVAYVIAKLSQKSKLKLQLLAEMVIIS